MKFLTSLMRNLLFKLKQFRQRFFYTRQELIDTVEREKDMTRRLMRQELEDYRKDLQLAEHDLMLSSMAVSTAKAALKQSTGELRVDVTFSAYLLRTPHEHKFIETLLRKIVTEIRAQDAQRVGLRGK